MILNLPNRVKIMGQQIEVKRPLRADIDAECNGGSANWETNTIEVATDLPATRQGCAFFHEILHIQNCYLSEKEVTYLSEMFWQAAYENRLLNPEIFEI